ncbi:MAG TPA: hypothetical protein VFG91_00155 [Woeseiaceae bacterium]|nr:hypothetical protein [Woeseiaceae bacterium]
MLDFSGYPLWINAAVFLAAAAAVWWAGTRLTHYADAISTITGLGQALIGMLLLGAVTSLPEIAVSVTAGLSGNAGLAVSNILGGVALQMVVIAIGDALLRGQAITFQVAKPAILLQAIFSCLLLCMIVAAVLVGDVAVAGVGLWSTGILIGGVLMLWLFTRYKGNQSWEAVPAPKPLKGDKKNQPESLSTALLLTAGAAAIILAAGVILTRTADAIATETGISGNFIGATLVAAATSLPEISTVVAAVRLKRYMMAFSEIFSTNIFDLMLIFLIDLAYGGPAVINEQGSFAAFGAVLGIAVTLIYVAGLIERRNKAFLRLGVDSWAVLATYFGGIGVLYVLS